MYGLGLVLLTALAVFAIASIVNRYLEIAREFIAATHVLLGIGAAWLAKMDLFSMWTTPARGPWIGMTLTGVAIGGAAMVWRESVAFMSGLERKFHDEAESIERAEGIRRVA
jgi:TctA family transporter